MKTWELIFVISVWCLIPAVHLLKMYLDNRFEKVCKDTQADIDNGIKELTKQIGG